MCACVHLCEHLREIQPIMDTLITNVEDVKKQIHQHLSANSSNMYCDMLSVNRGGIEQFGLCNQMIKILRVL